MRVLGAPISACNLFTSAFVGKTLKQAAAVIETTKSFRSVQHMVSLVTQSLVHKAAFLQRVVPPAQSMQAVTNEWDRTLKSVMEKIVQPHLIPDTSWDQAQLPIEKSGLGLLTWEYWGTINFVCSFASAMPRIAELFPNISCHISNDNSLPPTHEVFRRSRKDLLATFPRLEAAWLQGEKNYRKLVSKVINVVSDSRIQSLRLPWYTSGDKRSLSIHRSTYFDPHTLRTIGLDPNSQLSNPEFCIYIMRRFLLHIMPRVGYRGGLLQCTNCLKYKLDRFGDHAISCLDSLSDRGLVWHNAIRDTIHSMFKAAGFNAKIEQQFVSGRFLRIDNIVSDNHFVEIRTCTAQSSSLSDRIDGHAVAEGEKIKQDKYLPFIADSKTLSVVCVDDAGCWGAQALNLFNDIARALDGTKTEQSAFLTYWRRRLAVASARGVASLVLRATPKSALRSAHHCMPATPALSASFERSGSSATPR